MWDNKVYQVLCIKSIHINECDIYYTLKYHWNVVNN